MTKTSSYYRNIDPTPPQLVSTEGDYQLGTYAQAVSEINLLDANSPLGFKSPRWMKNIRLREWQAFQIGNKDHFCMAAIFNAKPIGLMHFVHYDIRNNVKKRYEQKVPYYKLKMANGLHNSTSYGRTSRMTFQVNNRLEKEKINLEIAARQKNLPDVNIRLNGQHTKEQVTPIVVCQPFDDHRVMYSHKALMPVSGSITLGETVINLAADDSWMIIDDHKGYYPRHTKWDWVTGAQNTDGKLIGFNLTNNQIKNQEKYNENCLWVDGHMHPLPPITYHRKDGIAGPWHITDAYGMVDITFHPDTKTSLIENFIVARTDYDSCYGTFEGTLKTTTGSVISISNCYGAGERFDITM